MQLPEPVEPKAPRRPTEKTCLPEDELCQREEAQRREAWSAKLAQLFYDVDQGFLSKRGLQNLAKREAPEIPAAFVSQFYNEQKLTQDLRAPRKRSFLPQAPGQQYHADLIMYKGSRSKKQAAFDLALVIVDPFTKKLSVYPLPNKSAESVSEAMGRAFYDLGGPPSFLVTDNGKEFQGGVRKLLSKLRVTHIIRLRHPRFIDRAQRTFRTMLYKRIASVNEPNTNLYKQVLQQYNERRHASTGLTPNELAPAEGSLSSLADARRLREKNDLAFAHMRYVAGKIKSPQKGKKELFLRQYLETRKAQREERRCDVMKRVHAKDTKPLAEIFSHALDEEARFLRKGDKVRRAIKLGTYFHQSENPHWFEEVLPIKEKHFNDAKASDGSPLFVLEEEKTRNSAELLYLNADLQLIQKTMYNPDSVPAERTNPRWQAYRDQTAKLAEAVLKLLPLSAEGLPKTRFRDERLRLPKPKDETKDPEEDFLTLDQWLKKFSLAPIYVDSDMTEEALEKDPKGKKKNLTAKEFVQRHGDFFQIYMKDGKEYWCLTETGKLFRTKALVEMLLSYVGILGKPWKEALDHTFVFETKKERPFRAILGELYDKKGGDLRTELVEFCILNQRVLRIQQGLLRPSNTYLAWRTEELAGSVGEYLLLDCEPQEIKRLIPKIKRGEVLALLHEAFQCLRLLDPESEEPKTEDLAASQWLLTLHRDLSGRFVGSGQTWALSPSFRAGLTQPLERTIAAALWHSKTPLSLSHLMKLKIPYHRLSTTIELQEVLRRQAHRKGDAKEAFVALLESHPTLEADVSRNLWTLTPKAREEVTKRKTLQEATRWQAGMIYKILRKHRLDEQALGHALLDEFKEKKTANWGADIDLQLNWKLTANLTISQHLLLESFASSPPITSLILPHWARHGPVKILNALLQLHSNLFEKQADGKWWAFPAAPSHDPSPVLS